MVTTVIVFIKIIKIAPKQKQQSAPTPNNPPGEEQKYNQGPPETTNQSTAQKYQRVHKTKAINVEISTSDARNARINT